MIAQPRPLPPPLSVGRYQIAGRASIGIPDVLRARDESGQQVAVYLVPAHAATGARAGTGLNAVYETVAAIDHPNVLRVLEYGREGGFEFLVTEWVEGTTLARLIEVHGRLPEANVIRFLAQIGQGLDHVQKDGRAPCRVAPGNVLIRADGQAKVIPFPLLEDRVTPAIGSAVNLLKPEFAAALAAERSTVKLVPFADVIFSMGTTLYEALTGSVWLPPSVESPGRKRRRATLVRPAGLTDRAERAIRRATDPNADQRPASCMEFLKLLRTRLPSAGTKKVDARTPEAATDNRRGCVRYSLGVGSNCTINASVFDPPDAPSETTEVWPLVVLDVSATGVGLLLARRCEPGTELSVEFETDAGRARRCLPARVVRVRKDNFGHWMHGCAFLTPLEEPELNALLDRLGRPDTL